MSFVRSLLFSTPLILLSTIVMWSGSMLSSIFDPTGNLQHRMARIWSKLLLAVSFIQMRAEGLEKLDPKANYVFVANHASYMDIPAILACLTHQFRFFAKKGLFSIPFLGWHLKRAGHVPVDRSNPRNSLKSMAEGARIVSERGISVLLFPEGGRTPQGLRPFKEGAAYIAIKARVPIVPMAILGTRELLPMGSIHLRGGRATLRIGDPIPTASLKLHDREALTLQLREQVVALLEDRALVG